MRLLKVLIIAAAISLTAVASSWAGEPSVSSALVDVLHDKGILTDDKYNDLKKTEATGGPKALESALLDTLHDKGILNDDSYGKLKAQADSEKKMAEAAPAAAPATPMASGNADRPMDKALTTVEEGFAKLTGDSLKLKIGMFFQGGWLNDDAGFSVASPPTSGNQFFVRRARLFLNGEITKKLGWRIAFETSASTGILRDAYVWMDYIPYTRVTVGQMKQPFGLETVEALADNPAVNRSMAMNFIQAPTLRDTGVMVSSKYATTVSGLPLGAAVSIGGFNGVGQNLTDNNDGKDVIGRLTINPLLPGLTVGGSFASGNIHVPRAKGAREEDFDKDRERYAAEAEYLPPYLKGLRVRGEFVEDRRFFTTYVAKNVISTSAPLPGLNRHAHSMGWYALAAYKVDGLKGGLQYLNGFEPVFRYDTLDEDTSTVSHFARGDFRDRVTLGLNYYFAKYARLMMDYEIIHADQDLRYRSLQQIDNIGHHLFTTLMQIKF